jgi:galactitol-specific phosphotransferase system IIB component
MNILNGIMKKILLAAGTGIYVKVLDKLETGLKKRGLANQYSITKCKVPELAKQAPAFDVIIRTALLVDKVDKPVVNGIGLATGGQAAEDAIDEIAALIKS